MVQKGLLDRTWLIQGFGEGTLTTREAPIGFLEERCHLFAEAADSHRYIVLLLYDAEEEL